MGTEVGRIEKEFVFKSLVDDSASCDLHGSRKEFRCCFAGVTNDRLELRPTEEKLEGFTVGEDVRIFFYLKNNYHTFASHTWIATDNHPGIAWADPDQIKADVSAAKLKADLVIVLLHSGIEISTYISNITDDQRLEAHTAIDAGAALVIGSHPHVLQQMERYHGGLIAYSLGNFVFDQYKGVADATIILRVVLTRDGVQSYDYVPALIDNGLPHVITEDLAPAIGTLVAPVNP